MTFRWDCRGDKSISSSKGKNDHRRSTEFVSNYICLETLEDEELLDDAMLGTDVGTQRVEEENFEEVSDVEVESEVRDPYQQWFATRVVTESDKASFDKILHDLDVVLIVGTISK